MITRPREYLTETGLPSPEMLRSVIREHFANTARLERLRAAYEGRNAILDRQKRDGAPNNRLAHPYARYITTLATGYLIGQPVSYSPAEESETLKQLQDVFRQGSEAAENTQLARDQSIYGKGVEFVHVDSDDNPLPHTTAVSPLNAFVVYDDTYDMSPLFGVYYLRRTRADGTDDGWRVWVMSDKEIARYTAATLDAVPDYTDSEPHYFGGVPLVEYWNNETETGDFEAVLSLIDAYDVLQSDRVNDKEQFVDRLLVITGAVLEADERGRKPLQQLREDRTLQLPAGDTRAEFLSSVMDESSVEVLRRALVEDIHKLSLVPDLSDANFAANASGVAMRYKLLGFEQMTRVKEQWFAEGLRARLKLYLHFMQLRGAQALSVEDIKITFTHALPANTAENAQIAQLARNAGVSSLRTGVSILHQGDNWTDEDINAEVDAISEERAAEALGALAQDGSDMEGI